MKNKVSLLMFFLSPIFLWSQSKSSSVDKNINEIFENATGFFPALMFAEIPITDEVGIPWVLIILISGALYFSIYFNAS